MLSHKLLVSLCISGGEVHYTSFYMERDVLNSCLDVLFQVSDSNSRLMSQFQFLILIPVSF